jgi:thiosulfate/3-mercaptopyruvate sulfurtransferase
MVSTIDENLMIQQLLTTTDWLVANLEDPALRIVDIRGHVIPASNPPPHYFNHRADYDQSHIPGAVFIDWVHEITDPDDPRHAQIAKPERFAAVMSRCGINADTQVVAYDDAAGMFAARLWWALNYYGHFSVSILDGGWDKWVAEGHLVTARLPEIRQAEFLAKPNSAVYRSGDQVEAALHTSTRLVDVRSPEEFRGLTARAKRKGHIPGAVNLPRTSLVKTDGTMLSPEELRVKFAEVGINASAPEVITYCNAGVSASYGLLALRAAGILNGAMYDGSWKDWGNDDARPIEQS